MVGEDTNYEDQLCLLMVGEDSNHGDRRWLVKTPTMGHQPWDTNHGTPTMEATRKCYAFKPNLHISLMFFLTNQYAYQPGIVPAKSEKK